MKTTIKDIPIGDLKPAPYNPRTIDDEAIAALASSMDHFGLVLPLVWNKRTGHVVGGNQRLAILRKTKRKTLPCSVVDLTLAREKILNLRLNNLSGEWNQKDLAKILKTIDKSQWQFTGFKEFEIEKLVFDGDAIQEDEIPDPPKKAITKTGDLWTLGEHRVLCGDATNGEDVARVMDGKDMSICLTDPPYGVNYAERNMARHGNRGVLRPYQEGNGAEPLAFMSHCTSDVIVMTYLIDRHFFALAERIKSSGFEFNRELVWVKSSPVFVLGSAYSQQHEPIMLLVRKGRPMRANTPKNASTVFEIEKPVVHEEHPTARPITLWCQLLVNHSKGGALVFDPFLGSGTTLIAAEQLGRKCCGLEIAPLYVDVCCERWANLTGRQPVLEENGKTFDEMKAIRKDAPGRVKKNVRKSSKKKKVGKTR